ncbi:hypothetical protein ABT282_07200 [Streptomyces sp. NPDC000927]|uniref:hypothetical protein n=1 Tax=Streptomyces sp. NPDC000927 TaxID=3154371 RepID=UPI003330EEC8
MADSLYLPTPELREGDIVLDHGMRILIDGPGKYREETYVWPGLVLNADELCDNESDSYDAYIARHLRGIWWEDRVPRPRKDDWPIQGNSLACWRIEPRP